MASGGYPLERLAALRAQRAAGAAIDLASALRGLAEAESALASAVAAREAADAAARAIVLVDGVAPAWEIARRAAYAERLRRIATRARASESDRATECAEWSDAVAAARAQVVVARGEHEVVERHRDRWEENSKRDRERRDE